MKEKPSAAASKSSTQRMGLEIGDDFELTAALTYLERRHPKLKSSTSFQDLLQRQVVSWEHVVPVFQELFVDLDCNPALCIAFRKVLLRLVGGWVESQKGASSCQASMALLNAVALAPHLERVVLSYFRHTCRCPLEFLDDCELGMKKQICYASLNALGVIPELKNIWGLKSWIKLLIAEIPELRYCGVRAISILLGLTDVNTRMLIREKMSEEMVLKCAMDLDHYSASLIFEANFKWIFPSPHEADVKDSMEENGMIEIPSRALSISELALPTDYVDICGLDLPHRQKMHDTTSENGGWMVATPTVTSNIMSAVLALCQHRPLLLEGPPGSGKTSLIRELAARTGNTDMIHVQIDDQTDSKSLLGAYVCTATPGEFLWQAGPLTQAVSQGKWLVIEDVNLAPPQVLVALIPLLERGTLHIPQRSETIKAAPGFQILATVTCSPAGRSAGAYTGSDNVKEILGGLWSHVYIKNPPLEEQLSILQGRFPELHCALPFIISVLHLVQRATGQSSPIHEYHGTDGCALDFLSMDRAVHHCLETNEMLEHSMQLHVGRHFSLRDVVKWCSRMKVIHGHAIGQMTKSISSEDYGDVNRLSYSVRQAAFIEACDCFASVFQTKVTQCKLMRCLAFIWALTEQEVEEYEDLHKPQIKVTEDSLHIGRMCLRTVSKDRVIAYQRRQVNHSNSHTHSFSHTGHASRMMEKVAVAVGLGEATLLVGDTGSGKTSLVQHVAEMVGAKLVVLNLSQQSGSSDLLGGFRPISLEDSLRPLVPRFLDLLRSTWTRGNNELFVGRILKNAEKGRWKRVEDGFCTAIQKWKQSVQACRSESIEDVDSKGHQGKKRIAKISLPSNKRPRQDPNASIKSRWTQFEEDFVQACHLRTTAEAAFAFAFMDGCLMKALKNGWWLLLDEINLAPPEVLECLAGVLDPSSSGSITLAEMGIVMVERHKDFRLIGAMNPATDIGKRDLPPALRNRFTEFWYPEPQSKEDLALIANSYLRDFRSSDIITKAVDFYRAAKIEAEMNLLDGAGHRPAYNLRTFCRWLLYVKQMTGVYGLKRSLYDGVSMAFLTQLEAESAKRMDGTIRAMLLEGTDSRELAQAPRKPAGGRHILFEQFWVEIGDGVIDGNASNQFILTESVRTNLKNLSRAVVLRKFPVLLQGPTSSGKTSLVAYLARQTGHTLIRINNHEHTDLQEYLGTYIADETGKLVFREGALVQAVRKGYWVVLDELNLAPTEVLEALNRLLDDNHELFIPETQETIKPHPQFMLFATQNPPGLYAGRKVLSKAFRSRFLEVHVDDIPDDQLAVILENRCGIAPSYAAKLVIVMKELQRRRQASNAFAGKHGFITPRDLFKWADREAVGYQELADNGYMILAERLRNEEEKQVVKDVLERTMRVKLDVNSLYQQEGGAPMACLQKALQATRSPKDSISVQCLNGIVWTKSMCRMYSLLDRCLKNSEPALLVGETGSGKTTVCQMLALVRGQKLHILNCNQHTETSDFLGGFRPTRDRERALARFHAAARSLLASEVFDELNHARPHFPESLVGFDLLKEALKAKYSIEQLRGKIEKLAESSSQTSGKKLIHDLACLDGVVSEMLSAAANARTPFSWVDGPLVEAMKQGDILLVDELNLAEDAVLERMNSVMETCRTLTLAEKGSNPPEVIIAAEGFRIVATMNPGGDFGKKELSPALSNRFTQIWVPQIEQSEELQTIVEANLLGNLIQEDIGIKIMEFWNFFYPLALNMRMALSVRDLLSWVSFVNTLAPSIGPQSAFVHGCFFVLLDGLGFGSGCSHERVHGVRAKCCEFLSKQINSLNLLVQEASGILTNKEVKKMEGMWGIDPFAIACGPHSSHDGEEFSLEAPTPIKNAFRLLRAMQLKKSILLEGSPGVGKTSLVAAIARMSNHRLTRINMSEQTDMMDLLGADLPVPGGGPGEFRWCDGPLLAAIKAGDWVLIDELNLASQQVLEGLNSVLDHRSEVFIPELGQTYQCLPGFRLFGAQNPLQEGGGRKGLPRSFLNRFTRVHVEALSTADMCIIAGCLYPKLPQDCVQGMVTFLDSLRNQVCVKQKIGLRGGPWEFNLRDLLRWCQLVDRALPQQPINYPSADGLLEHLIQKYAQNLFVHRFRTLEDRKVVGSILEKNFGRVLNNFQPDVVMTNTSVQIGSVTLQRQTTGILCEDNAIGKLHLLAGQREALECLAMCVAHAWPGLIIGNPVSGKNSIVRVLAQMCGRPLTEIALTQGTDTSDLLGGFEQMEIPRMIKEVRKECKRVLNFVISTLMGAELTSEVSHDHVNATTNILSDWEALETSMAKRLRLGSSASKHELIEELNDLTAFISHLSRLGKECLQPLERFLEVTAAMEMRIANLLDMCSTSEGSRLTAGRFEWVDGALCRAMENGDWVLLDNANLCNPTVLDRLNSALEANGVLYLNECGGVTGQPRVIKPHPEFRLFLAYNPQYGEVSRAMRNRGSELYLLHEDDSKSTEMCDLGKIIFCEGITAPQVCKAIANTHFEYCKMANSGVLGPSTLRDVKQWTALADLLVSRGLEGHSALSASWNQVYVRRQTTESAQLMAEDIFSQSCLEKFEFKLMSAGDSPSTTMPPGCPITVAKYCEDPIVAAMARETAVFDLLGNQTSASQAIISIAVNSDGALMNLVPHVHQLSSCLQKLCLSGDTKSSRTGEAIAMATNCLAGFGVDKLLISAELMLERAPLSQLDLLQSWCEQRLIHHKVNAAKENLGQEVYAANILMRVMQKLTTVDDEEPCVSRRNQIETHSNLPMGSSYGTAARQMPPSREADWWDRHIHFLLQRFFFGAIESVEQDLIERGGPSNPYQLSYQMFRNPELRASKKAVRNKILVWIFPLFSLISHVEKSAIDVLANENSITLQHTLQKQVRKLQLWRSALWMCCNGGIGTGSSFTIEAIDLDVLSYVWLKIRRLFWSILKTGYLSDMTTSRLQHTSEGVNDALDLPHELPPSSLLWTWAGHPVLPRSQPESDALLHLYKIAQDMSFGKLGFDLDNRTRPTLFELLSSGLDLEVKENSMGEGKTLDKDKMEIIMASLLSDTHLRRSLLEGLSMAASSCSLDQSNKAGVAGEILAHLRQAIISAAKAIDLTIENEQIDAATAISSSAAVFPVSLMKMRMYREYLMGLLLIEQSQMSKLIDVLPLLTSWSLIHGGMLNATSDCELGTNTEASLASAIRTTLEDISTPIVQMVPLQCLQWLTQVDQPKEQWTDWVHDMWYRWHFNLWENSLQDIPSDTCFWLTDGVELPSEALGLWLTTLGASHLYQASISLVSPSLVNQPTSISGAPAKMAQLKLAARQLFKLSTSSGRQSTNSFYTSLHKSQALLLAQILLAHTSSLADEQGLRLKALMSHVLRLSTMSTYHTRAFDVEGILTEICDIVNTSTHAGLRTCLESIVVPCLRMIVKGCLNPQQDMASWALTIGKVWALLGGLRLQLVLPPQGLDPSGKVSLQLHHIEQNLEHQIVPELQVRADLQNLPGGWSESQPIEFLQRKLHSDTEKMTKLREKCVLRPTPSQYRRLQGELKRFMSNIGSISRITGLIAKLEHSIGDAVNEACTWDESARGLCKRLSVDYPLYRDILQPVQLSLLEICHGLCAMACTAQMIKSKESGESLNDLVAALVSYPARSQCKRVIMDLANRENQERCSDMVAKSLLRLNKKNEDFRRTTFSVRISILRMVLQTAAKDAVVNWTISKSSSGLQHLDETFKALLHVWEDLGVYQSAKEEEDAKLFKAKTKTTSFMTDEEQHEHEYKALFPDHWGHFNDLMDLGKEDAPGDMMEIEDSSNQPSLGEAEAASKTAQSLLGGELLNEIVSHHLSVYSALGGKPASIWDIQGCYQEQYNLGTVLLAAAGGVAPRSLDDDAMSGHLLQICEKVKSLSENPSKDAGSELNPSISLEEPNVSEVKLSRAPLLATVSRLDALLEEWPEHPLLSQLKEIAERTLRFSIDVPLKQVLIGIEFFIGRSQVWEESAARHVSLREELKALTNLANRWRRLELSNWKTILDKRIKTHAEGAWKSWFYIYRLVMVQQGVDDTQPGLAVDFMSSLEQFIQTSTVGEFAERLRLLSVFQAHLRLCQGGHTSFQMSNILENLVNYYKEFVEPIQLKLKDGLAVIEKELKDFVKLAKWEDRGYYAMKYGADRAQRKLHKLCLGADKVLNIPAVMVLTETQKKLSLKSLRSSLESEEAKTDSNSLPEAHESRATEKWRSFCEEFRGGQNAMSNPGQIANCLGLETTTLRYNKLQLLTARMSTIVGSLPKDLGSEGSNIDDLASMAASRSLELSQETSKAAKSRKKKALSDFLKALSELGVSKRRSAIPRGKREMFDRFKDPVPILDTFWNCREVSESLPGALTEHAAAQWKKSQMYYAKTLGRIQKLNERSEASLKDISTTEKTAMIRYSQHGLYLAHHQRNELHKLVAVIDSMTEMAHILKDLRGVRQKMPQGTLPFPPQDETARWRLLQTNLLERLHGSVEDTMHLLSSVSGIGWTDDKALIISKGSSLLDYCKSQIEVCIERLGMSSPSLDLHLHKHRQQLIENFESFQALYAYLQKNEAMDSQESSPESTHTCSRNLSNSLPGWLSLMETIKEVSNESARALSSCQPDGHGRTAIFSPQDFCAKLEKCIETMLLWAQTHEGAKPSLDEANDKSILNWNEAILENANAPQAEKFCEQLTGLMKTLATACDHSRNALDDSASGELLSHMSQRLQRMIPALAVMQGGLCREVVRMVCLHKSVTKLAMVASSIFLSLVSEGFCTIEAPDEEEADGQETGALAEVEGTGIGEGKGKEDVSKEMEDEDQVLGAQPEKKDEEEEKPEQGQDENATGVEMDQDFDGEFEDVDGNNDQSGSDEEGDDDRLDDEMGKVGDQGDAVDERLWDQEDSKEPDGSNEDELDNDATAPVTDKSQLDYMEGQDEGEKKDNDSKDEPRKDQQPLQQNCAGEDEDPELADDGSEAGMGDEEPDQYQKEGLTKPEIPDQAMELPEDLNMDGEQGIDEDEDELRSGSDEEPQIQEGLFPDEKREEITDPDKDEKVDNRDNDNMNADEKEENCEEAENKDADGEGLPEDPDNANEQEPWEGQAKMAPDDQSGDETDDDKMQEEDPRIAQQEEGNDCADGEEGGPKGEPVGANADAEPLGAGTEEGHKDDLEEATRNAQKAETIGADQGLQSIEDAPQSNPSSLGPAGAGMKGAPAPADSSAQEKDQGRKQPNLGSNPFRSLGNAMERWKANLATTDDADEKEEDGSGKQDQANSGEDAQEGGEYQFMADGEHDANETQALATATEEQMDSMEAWDHSKQDNVDEDDMREDGMVEEEEMEDVQEDNPNDQGSNKTITGRAPAPSSKPTNQLSNEAPDKDDQDMQDMPDESAGTTEREEREAAEAELGSVVHLQKDMAYGVENSAFLDQEPYEGLSADQVDEIRSRIDRQLQTTSELRSVEQESSASSQEVWNQCQALTSSLVGELTEHLRIILEPTQASRLAGDYRSGKRINMKKVIAYVASQYRKDKIWMRRTKPDKRRYQVLLAIDDSKSMAENGCGVFALESLTLLCRAMSRLEVGELGVMNFGSHVNTLHPLGVPFTDASGPGIVEKMRFDQDNSIQDQPMVELITGLEHMLDVAQQRHSSGGFASTAQSLHQLVLVIADGRFHERESLKRHAHDLCNRKGVLVTFIVLDNPDNSLLDLSTVSFVDGQPQFSKYLDDFPFPLYIVLRDTMALPRTLADLLRQWFHISTV